MLVSLLDFTIKFNFLLVFQFPEHVDAALVGSTPSGECTFQLSSAWSSQTPDWEKWKKRRFKTECSTFLLPSCTWWMKITLMILSHDYPVQLSLAVCNYTHFPPHVLKRMIESNVITVIILNPLWFSFSKNNLHSTFGILPRNTLVTDLTTSVSSSELKASFSSFFKHSVKTDWELTV